MKEYSHFAGDEQLITGHTSLLDGFANFVLCKVHHHYLQNLRIRRHEPILIDQGTVKVPIANLQGMLHSVADFARFRLPCS